MMITPDEKLHAKYFYFHDLDWDGYAQLDNGEADFPVSYTKEEMIDWLKNKKHENATKITITEIWYCKRIAPEPMDTPYDTVISKEYDVREEMRARVEKRNKEKK